MSRHLKVCLKDGTSYMVYSLSLGLSLGADVVVADGEVTIKCDDLVIFSNKSR